MVKRLAPADAAGAPAAGFGADGAGGVVDSVTGLVFLAGLRVGARLKGFPSELLWNKPYSMLQRKSTVD
jgi:hypothetical protein